MKSTLALLLTLLAFQLEWTHPRALHENAAHGVRHLRYSPCSPTDPDHRHSPPWRSSRDGENELGRLDLDDGEDEDEDDADWPLLHLLETAGRPLASARVQNGFDSGRARLASLPRELCDTNLRC